MLRDKYIPIKGRVTTCDCTSTARWTCRREDLQPCVKVYRFLVNPSVVVLQVRSMNDRRICFSEAQITVEEAENVISALQAAVKDVEGNGETS